MRECARKVTDRLRLRMIEQRKLAGVSQAAVAARLELHHQSIGYIESGKQRLTVWHFLAYCSAIDVDPRSLLEIAVEDVFPPCEGGTPGYPG